MEVILTISSESSRQTSKVEASEATKMTQPAPKKVGEVRKETWQAAPLLNTFILFWVILILVKRPEFSLLVTCIFYLAYQLTSR